MLVLVSWHNCTQVLFARNRNCIAMIFITKNGLVSLLVLFAVNASAQQIEKKTIAAKRIDSPIKIDGEITEPIWKEAQVADKFIALRPAPFQPENPQNKTEIYFLYDDDGLYMGGYLHEKSKDSITHELVGRDGFGANDFIGFVFDTYYDKINGFEYFITPLGEQIGCQAGAEPKWRQRRF